jgi:hypothetical protein
MPKQDRKAGRPKKSKPDTIRFQAVLNRQYFQEKDAIYIAETLKREDPEKWTDRHLITQGMIALGEKLDSGWHPQDVPSTITIGAEIAAMLSQMKGVIEMLANMDIEGLRQVKGFNENTYKTVTTGASKLISGDTKFDDKEDW